MSNHSRRRYAVVGLSNRAIGQYVLPMIGHPKLPEYGNYSQHAEVVAVSDIDPARVEAFNNAMGVRLPYYAVEDVGRMIDQTRPDALIVAGPDGTHVEGIVTGLGRDIDVISEKPMVIDAAQARRVLEAEAKSKGRVFVTFNYRYTQTHMMIKRMIMEGKIGRVTNVEMTWNIDTYHGSSYFNRWNRDRAKSGGLSITKSCHHFDLVNWWVNDRPKQVFAYGALNYYGANSPHKPKGKLSAAELRARSPYRLRWSAPWQNQPKDDHLIAHEKVFNLPYKVQYPQDPPFDMFDEAIDIEDTYSVVVCYLGGASLSYSANFSAPWEGYTLGINGTHGRIEARHYTEPSRNPFPSDSHETLVYYPIFGHRQVLEVPQVGGGHGGADPMLKYDLFVERLPQSKELGLLADARQGADAVMVGEAVWRSIKENRPMEIEQLGSV
ncbi:MAG: Gfo/Idh/MocA family oxidoreductase [Phycisphaerales bacterium]|nr:Gfo/Idh/MocA family oxidoreductase [Phycisphaerales bacterium]